MTLSPFSGFLKKATGVLQNLGIGETLKFPGKDGDIVYSKNNVCVHPSSRHSFRTEPKHHPGYLTIYCQTDEAIGVTLVLQWLPNSTLERNPKSIHTISPRNNPQHRIKLRHLQSKEGDDSSSESSGSQGGEDSMDLTTPNSEETRGEHSEDEKAAADAGAGTDEISVEMKGDSLLVTTTPCKQSSTPTASGNAEKDGGEGKEPPKTLQLAPPSINVIPHTPVTQEKGFGDGDGEDGEGGGGGGPDESSPATSGADGDSAESANDHSSSPYSSSPNHNSSPDGDHQTNNRQDEDRMGRNVLDGLRSCDFLEKSPEEFAGSHNLMLPDHLESNTAPGLFSVDLGKMKRLRLFYSDTNAGAGQLVIASNQSQYKILHFHHGGLDKLAQIFQQWNAGSPDPLPNQQFAICRPELTKREQHPEEGLYEPVNWDYWRASTSPDGSIPESGSLKKAIFFAGMEETLRKEAWPFLLQVYPWNSTSEQRETIRNDLFLEYQNIRKKRMQECVMIGNKRFGSVEGSIKKDVVRTDRKHPYYQGDDNPHISTMHNILLNYAFSMPQVGYIQGMSDLLAPILAVVEDEAVSYWTFTALMQRSIFVTIPKCNSMEKNIAYLSELLKLMCTDFYEHLGHLGGDAPSLMFAHRWILLNFKREFHHLDSLKMWEACWTEYQTSYFHLFIAVAIVSVYGQDCLEQCLPHDEILLYFASLAMHMDSRLVLKKARGLVDEFYRMEHIPCTLGGLIESNEGKSQSDMSQWESLHQPTIRCTKKHEVSEDAEIQSPCPFASTQ